MAPVTLQATSREQVWVGGLDRGPHLLDLHFKGKVDQRLCQTVCQSIFHTYMNRMHPKSYFDFVSQAVNAI